MKCICSASVLVDCLLLLQLLQTPGHGNGDRGHAEVGRILEQVDVLIHTHSLRMDPSGEKGGGQKEIVSEFHACLVELCQTGGIGLLGILTNKVLVGVYKRRGHAIKYMLSSEGHETVGRGIMESLPEWGNSTELLVELLGFRECVKEGGGADIGGGVASNQCGGVAYDEGGVASDQRGGACNGGAVAGEWSEGSGDANMGIYPLDLAVKLGLLDVASLLVQAGMKVCPSHFLCNGALHYATINQDLAAIGYILECVQSEWATSKLLSQQLCHLLTLNELTFRRSPLDIAYFQCNSGLSCDALTHLLQWARTWCDGGDFSPHSFPYDHKMCPARNLPHSHGISPKERWLRCVMEGRGCEFGAFSGHWRVYGDHSVGRMDCGLTRIAAGSVTPIQFERDFVNTR